MNPSITKRPAPQLSGGMTAHQAWAVVAPMANALDQHAKLTLITDGLDMNNKDGVDFVAGPSDVKLEGRILPSGEAVWVTCYWDREHNTSFKTMGS